MWIDLTLNMNSIIGIVVLVVFLFCSEMRHRKWMKDEREKTEKHRALMRTKRIALDSSAQQMLDAAYCAVRGAACYSANASTADLRRVEDKVDESNRRLARLEGIVLTREGMVDTLVESIVDAPQ